MPSRFPGRCPGLGFANAFGVHARHIRGFVKYISTLVKNAERFGVRRLDGALFGVRVLDEGAASGEA
jgi:hypothetical protein